MCYKALLLRCLRRLLLLLPPLRLLCSVAVAGGAATVADGAVVAGEKCDVSLGLLGSDSGICISGSVSDTNPIIGILYEYDY